jgi:hypothetical protein
MSHAKSLVLFVAVFAVCAFGADSALAQEECGHCHQEQSPFWPYNYIHQFTSDLPAFSVCSGGGGHPMHDCVNGDPAGVYAPGPCHPPCAEGYEELAATLFRGKPLFATSVADLQAKYPDHVSFDGATGIMSLRDCAGRIVELNVAVGRALGSKAGEGGL